MPRLTDRLLLNPASGGYRTALAISVAILPTLAAWDYGGVLPWTRWCLSIASLILLVLSIPLVIQRRPNKPFGYAIVIVGLGVWGYGLAQLIPMPAPVVGVFSPASRQAYLDGIPESLLGELDAVTASGERSSMEPDQRWIPISVAPYLTRDYLVIPAVFASFVFLGIHVLRGDRELLLFLTVTTVSGIAISYMGIADKISEHGEDFLAPANAKLPFGSFVNRNNAAGYLNLCLGCCIGALVYRQRMGSSSQVGRYEIPEDTSAEGVGGSIRRFLRRTDSVSIAIVIAIIILVSGILVAGSRGGMLACAAGIVMVTYRTVHRTRRFGSLATISLAAIGLGLVIGSIGMTEAVRYRLSQIMGPAVLEDDRLTHWQDSIRAAIHYGPLGSGLGSYRYSYLPFQKAGADKWFVNADGMPLEWLLEGGLPMIVLPIVGIVCVYRLLWHLSKRQRTPATVAIDRMTWFVVPSIVISQCFDFGILLLANSTLLGLILGCLSAQATKGVRRTSETARRKGSRKRSDDTTRSAHREDARPSRYDRVGIVAMGVWGTCLVSSLLAAIQQNESARLDYVRRDLEAWRPDLVEAKIQIAQIREEAVSLLRRYPTNPEVLDVACRANLLRSRFSMLSETTENLTTENLTREQFDNRWLATDPVALRHNYHLARLSDQAAPWTTFLPSGQDPRDWMDSRKWALRACWFSPLNPDIRFTLVSLDFVEDAWISTEDTVRHLRRLRQRRPNELNRVAVLATTHPGSNTALDIWRDAMDLAPEMLPKVWSRVRELEVDISLVDLAPRDLEMLLFAAESLAEEQQTVDRFTERIEDLIDRDGPAAAKDKATWHFQLGRLAVLEGDVREAEQEFSKAIQQNPGESSWRDRYIDILIANENYAEASEQIDRQLLKDPANPKLLKLRDFVDETRPQFPGIVD